MGKQANFEKARNDEIPDEKISIVSKDGRYRVSRIKWDTSGGRVDNTLQIVSGGVVQKIDVPEGISPQEAVETAQSSDEYMEMLAKKLMIVSMYNVK